MTPIVVALLVGFAAGLTAGTAVARIWFNRSWDEWHYRQLHAEPAHVPPIADPNLRIASLADHEHRVEVRVKAQTRELRAAVGDLLDTVATLRTQLDGQRDPIPVYGARHKART